MGGRGSVFAMPDDLSVLGDLADFEATTLVVFKGPAYDFEEEEGRRCSSERLERVEIPRAKYSRSLLERNLSAVLNVLGALISTKGCFPCCSILDLEELFELSNPRSSTFEIASACEVNGILLLPM